MIVNKDVYLIINSIIEQTEGKKNLTLTDVSDVVSFGKKLLSSNDESSRDVVFKALLDRIGKTIIDNLPYDNKFSRIFKDAFAYGSVLQTIYVSNFTAKESGVYDNLDNGDVDDELYKTYKATVEQNLFENVDPWEFAVTIFDAQITSAFVSAEGAAGFLNGIYTAMENSVTKYLEDAARASYMSLIIADLADGYSVNVLQEYYNETGIELDDKTCMYNEDFNKWLTGCFTDKIKLMEEMTVLFNHVGHEVFTPRDRNHFVINAKIADNIKRFMASNVYHDELVSMPNYDEVSSWQAIGKTASLADRLSVYGKCKNPKYTAGGTEPQYWEANAKVIAIMHDDRVMSLTLKDRRTATHINEHGARRNVWEQGVISSFVNLGHNSIVFYLGEVVKPVDVKLNKNNVNIATGATEQLTATINPLDASLTWGTSNASVATVSDGLITGEGVGTAVISAIATKNGVSDIATALVNVTASSLTVTGRSTKRK